MVIFFEQLEVNYVLFIPSIAKEARDSATIPRDSDINAITKDKDNRMKKYRGDDAGIKNYVIGEWLKFHMTDDKPITDQVDAYKKLVSDILVEGMQMCEILQINVLIEKLSKSWYDYRNLLKHKKRNISSKELISYTKIEEANHFKDKALFT
ncbi:uncharacterized protein [Gossypium hirsutum]|uniref:Uncharacterized protein n=1 Tax=Gossypium hirsutum TaxID=3635 RepID=A0ABM2ZZU7_GOSHI|nr:uncharacterized protein LOC121216804 [Gossypium hirsutum]